MNFDSEIAVGIHLLEVMFTDIETLCRTRVVFRVKPHEFGFVNVDFNAPCFAEIPKSVELFLESDGIKR